MSDADLKARFIRTWDRADRPNPRIERITNPPDSLPEHFTLWTVNGAAVALPTLSPFAPVEIARRYMARVVATASGTCSLCGAVASIDADPMRAPAHWHINPVTVGLTHAPSCPAEFTDEDRQWFPLMREQEQQ